MQPHREGPLDRVVPTPMNIPTRRSTIVRFLEKVEIQPGGHWLWRGSVEANGYGYFRHRETKYAHRAAYLLMVGPIPDGHQIDHLCRIKLCVKPDHLEAVVPILNVERAAGRWTSCDIMHPDTATRVGWKKSGRAHCLECNRLRELARRERFRAH